MSKVLLGDVAIERRESVKADADKYPSVGLEHLAPGEIELTSWDTDKTSTFNKLFRKGDVLFGRRRAYLKKAVVAPFDGICSGDITVIAAKKGQILPELLPFVIQNDNFFDYATEKSAGSLSPRVKWGYLKDYEFELPSIEGQAKLAKVLWSIEDTKKAYKKLIKATDELVNAQFVEMFGDVKNNVRGLPIKKLGEICSIERGGSPRPISKYITDSKEGINWIKIGDADGSRYISSTAEKIIPEGIKKSRKVQAGDLILSNSMSFGHPYILKIDGCIHDGWLVIHFPSEIFDALYLQTYLGLPYTYSIFESMAAGGVVNNLNSEIVKQLPILIPTINEQREFSDYVKQSDKSKFELEQSLNKLTVTYKCILNENLG